MPTRTDPQSGKTPPRRRSLSVAALASCAVAVLVAAFGLSAPAAAHGTAITPASRQFSCWQRWGDDFQDPAMQTEDPMCWQAWQADPNAMWNWNGLYRNGLAGDFEGSIPDGQLCSGGLAAAGRYAALDEPGDWHATQLSTDFTFVNVDEARHGADFYRIYVSKQGYDPTSRPLGWDDLQLAVETGPYAPGEGDPVTDPALTGVTVSIPVSVPGLTGRHIVFMIWQAAHMDQAFFSCSDVDFG